MEAHNKKVERIAIKVQEFYHDKTPFRIFHGCTNTTRRPHGSATVVDTSDLNNIIDIDLVNNIAIVEANVATDTLLEATLKFGRMPLIMTEFPGTTWGGAYSGATGESSSFKYGYVDRTVSKIEMVLGNGEVVQCSELENADIFRGAAGALGTLGVITLLHVRLEPAAKWVEVTYHPFSKTADALELFQRLARDEFVNYLDAILFSAGKGVVMSGQLRNSNPLNLPIKRFSRAKDPWYCMHVEDIISEDPKRRYTELIPLPDYIFRYNRGGFWLGKYIFDLTGLPFSRTTRRLLDFLLKGRMLYKSLHAQNPTSLMIVQDCMVPFSSGEEFVEWSNEKLGVFPLWWCPVKKSPSPTLQPHPLHMVPGDDKDGDRDMLLDVALFGPSPDTETYEDWITANTQLEEKVYELGGMKISYGAQLYSKDGFWKQHDREWYDRLRERCHAHAIPDIFEKTTHDVVNGRKIIAAGTAELLKSRWPEVLMMKYYWSLVWASVKSRAWRLERHKQLSRINSDAPCLPYT